MRNNLPPEAEKPLKAPLALTRAGLVVEAVLRAFWPVFTLAMFAAAALASGLVAMLPPRWGMGLLAALAAGCLVTLVLGLRRFRLPGATDAVARLDAQLPGQPISALTDVQAVGAGDGASRAVWQTHRSRMASRLAGARPVPPRPDLAPRDPYALRLMALVALVMALGFGIAFRVAAPSDLLPRGAASATMAPASWEGWIEPPAYTGRPSLYLADQPPGILNVPKGSRMIVRFYGRVGDLRLSEDLSVQDAQTEPGDGAQTSFSFTVERDGVLEIAGPGGARWQVVAMPDRIPQIGAAGDLARTLAGDLELPFAASDDYAVQSAAAEITLDLAAIDRRFGLTPAPEPRDPIAIDLPMPFRGDRSAVEEVLVDNFAEHPWAGLPVTMVLSASDEAGQTGRSEPLRLVLPGRRFLDPLAMALIEQRRDLLWSRENAPRVARLIRAISNRPDGFFSRDVTYLMLRTLSRTLEGEADAGLSISTRDQVAQDLWDIAIGIEEGNLDDARERLRRAQERLAEAMRQGASPDELSELMDELRDAMRDYTRQLAQQAPQPGNQAGADQPDQGQPQQGQEITQGDLDAMMDAIEQAMREGRQEEAMAMLQQLQELTENMRAAETRQGQGGAPGDQAMEGLADSLTRQQGLSDEAFRDLQEQSNPSARTGESDENVGRNGGRGKGRAHDGEGGKGEGESAEGDLAQRQQDLADSLGDQRRNLPGAGSEGGDAARQALRDAERAMREAAEGLKEGDLPGALDRQAEAMEALREGMRQLDRAMAEARQDRQGQQGANSRAGSARPTDPLGRGSNSRGGLTTDAPLQQGDDVYRRAEELMQELRRRAGEGTRPEPERNYLRRLLEPF